MASTLLTASAITREAIRLWKNTNSLLKVVDHQYDNMFAQTGAKNGTSIRIRLPNDYVVTSGATAVDQDTTEGSSTLTVASQYHIAVPFSSLERTMQLDDFSKRVLAPMLNNMTGQVALSVMSGVEAGASNFVSLTSAGAIIAPSMETWLLGAAKLDENAAPRGMDRCAIIDPISQARAVALMTAIFNPQSRISKQFDTGEMTYAFGFDWMMDQTTLKHTTAAYSGTKTVNGAAQTGLTLVTNALTGGLKKGDIIELAGVFAVNRITKESTGALRQFVVTADVASAGTSVPIYPAIVPLSAGNKVAYQTVDASPANAAVITVVTATAEIYRKNFVMHKDAVTMATADLEMPGGVHEVAREQFDGVSMRFLSQYSSDSDKFRSRLDVLFGYLWIRPEWVCVVADKI